MKSKFTFLSILLFAFATGLFAVPMSGTYTIGGTTPNFPTIQKAMDTLYARGVNGAVIFNIRPGTYNGQININNVNGVSATNTITIKSENNDSTSVILTDTASQTAGNFLFHVYRTDYLTLKNLTLYRIGNGTVNTCTVINLASNSKYFRLIGCIVKNDFTGGFDEDQSLVYFPSGSSGDSLITIDNNIFINGSMALYLWGQTPTSNFTNLSITNNQFIDQSTTVINLHYATNPLISNNIFTTNSTAFGLTALLLDRVLKGMEISFNQINGFLSGTVISLDSVMCSAATPGVIANNFISTLGSNATTAISFNTTHRINIDYNSININSTTGGQGIFIDNSASDSLNFRNNIIVNAGGGVTFYVTGGSTSSITTSDYNDLYSTGPVLAFYLTADDSTLAQWQTASGQDAHSVSAIPLFISGTDLHSGSPAVNNAGTPIAGITTDIDGQSRSVTTPDIGADEFTPLADNIGAVSFILPSSVSCGDSAVVISVVLKNYGLNAQTGFSVKADITGLDTTTLTDVFNSSLASNTTDTLTFTTTVNTYAGGVLDVTVYTSLNADQYHANDTIHRTFTFLAHPNAPVIPSPQQVCDNNAIITGMPDSTDVLVWYDQPSGGTLLHVGNDFNPPLTSDTTFYVEAHTGSGGTGCLRISEIQPEDNPSDFIEITNVSGVGFDATGWKVIASDSYTDISVANAITWDLSYFNGGEVRFRTDNGTDTNYWGANLLWANGNSGWAMIIDNNNEIVDFMAWDWDTTSIINMAVPFNGDTLRPGAFWNGAGVTSCPDNTTSMQRTGNDDNDNLSDWSCLTNSPGVLNANLSSSFSHCGIGLCGSIRVPVSVQPIPGVTPVNLGPDTVVGNTDSLLLDAGTGYTTYLWSTGDTTQTIYAGQGTFWVTVSGGVNNCSYTDSIIINTPVTVKPVFSTDEIVIYPNPANNKLTVSATESVLRNSVFRITDIEGRVLQMKSTDGNAQIIFNLEDLTSGIYYLQIISGEKSGVKKFSVIK